MGPLFLLRLYTKPTQWPEVEETPWWAHWYRSTFIIVGRAPLGSPFSLHFSTPFFPKNFSRLGSRAPLGSPFSLHFSTPFFPKNFSRLGSRAPLGSPFSLHFSTPFFPKNFSRLGSIFFFFFWSFFDFLFSAPVGLHQGLRLSKLFFESKKGKNLNLMQKC